MEKWLKEEEEQERRDEALSHTISIFGDRVPVDTIRQQLEINGWNKEIALEAIDALIPKIQKITFEDR